MSDTTIVVLLVVLFLLSPLATIWAVNTLFGLGIAYTFKTWLAMFLLQAALAAGKTTKRS